MRKVLPEINQNLKHFAPHKHNKNSGPVGSQISCSFSFPETSKEADYYKPSSSSDDPNAFSGSSITSSKAVDILSTSKSGTSTKNIVKDSSLDGTTKLPRIIKPGEEKQAPGIKCIEVLKPGQENRVSQPQKVLIPGQDEQVSDNIQFIVTEIGAQHTDKGTSPGQIKGGEWQFTPSGKFISLENLNMSKGNTAGKSPVRLIGLSDKNCIAKNSVIQELIADGVTEKNYNTIERALSHFSLDNLLLLRENGVKFEVRNICDMPEDFDGFNIKERFMGGHRALIDQLVVMAIVKYRDLQGVNPDSMDLLQKKRFLKDLIENRGHKISLRSDEFGLTTFVDKDNIRELDNISQISGTTFPKLSYPGVGVFFLNHNLTEGVVIHEAAHALDVLKNIEQDPGALAQMRREHVIVSATNRDWNLGAHYNWFLKHCRKYPQDVWSNYAVGGLAYEYSAEAVRLYCENPTKLLRSDYDMYCFAEEFIKHRAYPHIRFQDMDLPNEYESFLEPLDNHLNTNTELPERHNIIPAISNRASSKCE